MEPATLAQILDISFYVLIGIIILKALLGLKKGVWKSLCSFLVSVGLYITIIVLNTRFTEWYYSWDLSGANLVFSLNGNQISVQTIGQTLRESIIVLVGEQADLSPSSEIFKVCDSLAMSLLAFVVFIVHVIIVAFLLAPLISFLLYHLLFRPLLGKTLTKKHKLRIAGFFVNGVKAAVTTALLLTPFTALVNQISDTASQYDFEGNEQAQLFTDYVDAYQGSSLAKVLTSVRMGGKSVDVVLTDYVTSFEMGNDVTSFLNEIGFMLDIACEGIKEGVVDLNTFTIDYTSLISKTFVTKVLQQLASSKLVTTLLPVALSIVVNLEDIRTKMDLTEIDWNRIDWSDELNAISDIYQQFYDTGILTHYVIDQEDFQAYALNRESYQAFHRTFSSLEHSEVLSEVMPYVMVSFANYMEDSEFSGIFPTELSAYREVRLGKELAAIYDAVVNLSDLASYSSLGRNLTIGDLQDQDRLNEVMDFILSDRAVYGGTVEEGTLCYTSDSIELTGREPIEIKTVDIFNGIVDEEETIYLGLLDSELIGDHIDGVLKFVTRMDALKQFKLEEAIDRALDKIDTKEKWKKEIDSLLCIVPIVYNNPDLPLDTFDMFDEKQVDELKRITPYVDRSVLVKEMAQPIVTTMMGDTEIYGLTAADFDFSCEDLGTQLYQLFDILPEIGEVQESLEGGVDALLNPNSFRVDSVEHILTTVYESKILNPETSAKLNNFERLLMSLFQENTFSEMGFEVNEDLMLSIRNSGKQKRVNGGGWIEEIGSICEALRTLQNASSVKDMILSDQNFSLTNIDAGEINDLIKDFSASRLINHSMGNILNKYLEAPLNQMHMEIDFNAVSDWSDEADCLSDIIVILQEMQRHSFSLENIDLSSLDYEYTDGGGIVRTGVDDLGDVLKSVYRLQCVGYVIDENGQRVESGNFGKFIYENVTQTAFGSYMNDEEIRRLVQEDHAFSKNEIAMDESSYVDWWNEESGTGVIEDIVSLMRYLVTDKYVDSDGTVRSTFRIEENQIDILGAIERDSGVLDTLLKDLNRIYVFRTLIGEVIDQTVKDSQNSFYVEGLDFSTVYSNVFNEKMNYKRTETVENRAREMEIREKELSVVCEIYTDLTDFSDVLKSGMNIADVDTSDTMILNDLLHALSESEMFNERAAGKDQTFFENMLSYILDSSSLSEMMKPDEYQHMTSEKYASEIVRRSVDNSSAKESAWRVKGEDLKDPIDHLIDALNAMIEEPEEEGGISIKTLFKEGAETNEEILKDIPPSQVGRMISACASSEVFCYNNGIGHILNSQLGNSFKEKNLVMDFAKVGSDPSTCSEEWKKEGDLFEKFLTAIKEMNHDEDGTPGPITFDFDIATLDVEYLEPVLDSLNALQVLQNNNEEALEQYGMDNFGYFIYKNITEPIFGSYIDERNQGLVYEDHTIDLKKKTYRGEIEVAWRDSRNEIYQGENHSLVKFVSFARNNLMSEKNFDVHNLITSDLSLLNQLLMDINEIHAFRTILNDLIRDQLSASESVQIEVDFTKANMELFDYEYNYLNISDVRESEAVNRESEILLRKGELDRVIQILNDVDTIGSTVGTSSTLDTFRRIIPETIDALKEMHDSRIFNGNNSSVSEETTVFEDMVKYIMDRSTLTEMIVPNGIDPDENAWKIILSVSQEERSVKGSLSWKDDANGELYRLESFLTTVSEINDRHGRPFTGISQASELSSEQADKLLNCLNVSYLCHGAVANSVDQIYASAGIKNYALDPVNAPIDAHCIDTEYPAFEDRVRLWDEEIPHLIALYDRTKDGIEHSIGKQENHVREGVFGELLPDLMALRSLGEGKYDVLYGIFKDAGVESYISEYGNGTDANLNRRDLLRYLGENKIADWTFEAQRLDLLVNTLMDNKDGALSDAETPAIEGSKVRELVRSTYVYEKTNSENFESNYKRGYLASEIVSTFIGDMMTSVDETQESLKMDWRKDYTYLSLNEFEAEGLNGVLDSVLLLSDFTDSETGIWHFDEATYANWKNLMRESVSAMGNGADPEERFYYLDGLNSVSASKLFSFLSKEKTQAVDRLIEEMNASILVWNQSHPEDRLDEIPSLNWSVDEKTFEEKGEEWIRIFDQIFETVQRVRS